MTQWLNQLKVAITNEDVEKIAALNYTMPSFEKETNLSALQESEALVGKALQILKDKKNELGSSMERTKASLAYQKNMKK